MNYAYIQVAMTIMNSLETENREYRPFESIRDGYPKYLLAINDLVQKRNGVKHMNIPGLIKEEKHNRQNGGKNRETMRDRMTAARSNPRRFYNTCVSVKRPLREYLVFRSI